MDPYISYQYTDGRHDREVEAQCSSAHLRISAGVARPLPGESTDVYTAWCDEQDLPEGEQPDVDAWEDDGGHGAEDEAPDAADDYATEPEDEAEPEEEAGEEEQPQTITADDDESDGWPEGYTYTRRGSYYDVTAPDGDHLGTFRGETAGIEGAWRHHNNQEATEPEAESGGT